MSTGGTHFQMGRPFPKEIFRGEAAIVFGTRVGHGTPLTSRAIEASAA